MEQDEYMTFDQFHLAALMATLKVAKLGDVPIAIVGVDIPVSELFAAIVGAECRIAPDAVLNGRLTDQQKQSVRAAEESLMQMRLMIMDTRSEERRSMLDPLRKEMGKEGFEILIAIRKNSQPHTTHGGETIH